MCQPLTSLQWQPYVLIVPGVCQIVQKLEPYLETSTLLKITQDLEFASRISRLNFLLMTLFYFNRSKRGFEGYHDRSSRVGFSQDAADQRGPCALRVYYTLSTPTVTVPAKWWMELVRSSLRNVGYQFTMPVKAYYRPAAVANYALHFLCTASIAKSSRFSGKQHVSSRTRLYRGYSCLNGKLQAMQLSQKSTMPRNQTTNI